MEPAENTPPNGRKEKHQPPNYSFLRFHLNFWVFGGFRGDGGGAVNLTEEIPSVRFTWIPATSPWKSVVGEVVLQVAVGPALGPVWVGFCGGRWEAVFSLRPSHLSTRMIKLPSLGVPLQKGEWVAN